MKNKLLKSSASILMITIISSTQVFAQDNIVVSMNSKEVLSKDEKEETITSEEFLNLSNEKGEITLDQNIILDDSLKIDKDCIVDLNGFTLKFTKPNNFIRDNANVTFKNGNINFDDVVANGDCILGIGNYGNSANLTLDSVKLEANNYSSAFALIYVYNDSELNITKSTFEVKNEKSKSGGVIKTNQGTDGKINIIDSTLNFENTTRGFVDGTINIKNSKVEMNGLVNAINSGTGKLNLTIDNSNLTIANNIAYGLTIDKSNVNIKNNSVVKISSVLADIRFNSEGQIKVDESSKLNFKDFNIAKGIEKGLNDLIELELGLYEYKLDDKGKLILDDNGNPIRFCSHGSEKGTCNICDGADEIGDIVADIEGVEIDGIHVDRNIRSVTVSINNEDTEDTKEVIENLAKELGNSFNFEIVEKSPDSEASDDYIIYKVKLNPKVKSNYTHYIEIKVPANNEDIINKIEDVFKTEDEDSNSGEIISPIPPQEEIKFNDIKGHWAESTIKSFVDKGFIDGYKDSTFRPNNSMTRAEFVKLVNRVFGFTQKGEEQFTDVNKEDWFYDDICIGIKEGYIKGKSKDVFAPNDNITREEVAMILTNIMKNKDENLDKLDSFKDGNKTSQWAQSSVEGAIEAGYMNGYEDQTIKASGSITRAEAVSMLSRVKKEEVSSILEEVEGYRSTRTQQIFTSFKINESLNLAPFSKDNVRIIYLNENGDAIAGLTKDKTWGGFLNNNTTKFPKGLENNSEYSNNLEPGIYTSTTKASDTDKYKDVKSVKVVVIKDGVEYSSKFEI